MSCFNPFDFGWQYQSLGFEVSSGSGTCIAMQTPKYLAFDGMLNPDSINWMVQEDLTLVEAISFVMSLSSAFQDTITFVEDAAITMTKGFADVVTLVEALTIEAQWFRRIDETITLVEVVAKRFEPQPVEESIALIEAVTKKITLRFAETIHLTETFSNGKNQNLADSFALVEAGFLNTQDYFDTHTYFAGDYFGQTRTW